MCEFSFCVQLCQSCHVEVARQANAALLNMASSEGREMGKRGAVETLLGTLQ